LASIRTPSPVSSRQPISSPNNFINAAVAASVAQEETLAFFDDRLKDVDLEGLHQRVMAFMAKTKPGTGPTIEAL
jgi:hypothetical protein